MFRCATCLFSAASHGGVPRPSLVSSQIRTTRHSWPPLTKVGNHGVGHFTTACDRPLPRAPSDTLVKPIRLAEPGPMPSVGSHQKNSTTTLGAADSPKFHTCAYRVVGRPAMAVWPRSGGTGGA